MNRSRGGRLPSIAVRDDNVVLIHAGAALENNGPSACGSRSVAAGPEVLRGLGWYCEWITERKSSVYLLLPDHRRSEVESALSTFGSAAPLWYTDDSPLPLPPIGRRSRVWMVNGGQLPVVDWDAADASARRVADGVLLFGPPSFTGGATYAESVLVGDSDEVVRFQRHYGDSPAYTDLWSDEVSLLVTSGEKALAAISHVLLRGWGLESIGAMTRRFTIRWADAPCVITAFGQASVVTGPLAQPSPAEAPSTTWRWHSPDFDPPTVEAGVAEGSNGTVADVGLAAFKPPAQRQEDNSCSNGRPGHAPTDLAEPELAPEVLTIEQPALHAGPGEEPGDDRIYLAAKRLLDILGAVVGLILLSPLMLAVALLVKLSSRGPVFFAHRRQGLGGAEFNCLKFRSMTEGADNLQAQLRGQNEVDGPQFKIARDPRLTKIGRWLRETNLDELPQLLNVLMGQMSLVGPRPSPDNENQFCPAWRRARLSVKPGITGLWQVLRRRDDPDSDFQQWIYYDVAYAQNRSFWLDVQLLLYTPAAILAPRYLDRFAAKLARNGICTRMEWLESSKGTDGKLPS